MKTGILEKIETVFEQIEEWGNQLRLIQKQQIEKESGISVELTIEWAKAWIIQKLPKKYQLTAIQLLSE